MYMHACVLYLRGCDVCELVYACAHALTFVLARAPGALPQRALPAAVRGIHCICKGCVCVCMAAEGTLCYRVDIVA